MPTFRSQILKFKNDFGKVVMNFQSPNFKIIKLQINKINLSLLFLSGFSYLHLPRLTPKKPILILILETFTGRIFPTKNLGCLELQQLLKLVLSKPGPKVIILPSLRHRKVHKAMRERCLPQQVAAYKNS